jgi:hypothetical protein
MSHKSVANRVESISMASGVIAGLSAAGAAFAAPSGFDALGIFLGMSSDPLIVTAAPVLGIMATVTGVISGGTFFYSKWKESQDKDS